MKIKVFVQSCLMCLLDNLGIQMLRGQQPLQNIMCVYVLVFHTDLSLKVLRPVFVYLCVCVCVCVFVCVIICDPETSRIGGPGSWAVAPQGKNISCLKSVLLLL